MRSLIHISTALLLTMACTVQVSSVQGGGLQNATEFNGRLIYVGQLRADYSYLGVEVINVLSNPDRPERRGAVQITALEQGSPALEAGLRPGDMLITFAGEKIVAAEQLGTMVRNTRPQERVRIQYLRGEKLLSTTVTMQSLDSEQVRRLQAQAQHAFGGLTIPDMPSAVLVWRSSLLGIECEPIDSQLALYFGVEHGVLIRFVMPGSVVAKAGVKAGDVLLKVEGRSINDVRDLTTSFRNDKNPAEGLDAHKAVPLTLKRDHKELTVKLSLGEPMNGLW